VHPGLQRHAVVLTSTAWELLRWRRRALLVHTLPGAPSHKKAALACAQALTGAAVVVDALDGRRLRIPAPGVLAAGAELRAAGEGLCGKVVSSQAAHCCQLGLHSLERVEHTCL